MSEHGDTHASQPAPGHAWVSSSNVLQDNLAVVLPLFSLSCHVVVGSPACLYPY